MARWRRAPGNSHLSADLFRPDRPYVSASADLLRLRLRGNRAAWPLDRGLDRCCPRLPLPSLGHAWLRSGPDEPPGRHTPAPAVALRDVARAARLRGGRTLQVRAGLRRRGLSRHGIE